MEYDKLPNLSLELILEIGETDEFLPGNLNDMMVTSQGQMLVSDYSRTSIEQISPAGEYLGSVATQGGGPGELTQWFRMSNKGSDTLMVQHQSGMFAFYGPGPNGKYEFKRSILSEVTGDRRLYIVGPRSENEYYGTIGQIIRDVETFAKSPETHSSTEYVVTDSKMNIVQDSIFFLNTARSHIHMIGSGFTVFSLPYRVSDVMRVNDDGSYIVANPYTGVITFHDNNFAIQKQVELNVKERLVSNQELARVLENIREDARQDVMPKIATVKPIFLDLWATENHLFLHTDNLEDGREIVVLDGDGGAVGRFIIDNIDIIKHFNDNLVYVLSKDPDHGDMIRVYEWQ